MAQDVETKKARRACAEGSRMDQAYADLSLGRLIAGSPSVNLQESRDLDVDRDARSKEGSASRV